VGRNEERDGAGLQCVLADLHVHTCLSACASLDMTPVKIVRRALAGRLGMIGITDHNSVENCAAVMKVAAGTDLCVLPGMELTTAEEAHLVALFPDLESALVMQELVYQRLLPGENDEELFGLQVVATENDEVERMNPRLLSTATTLPVDEAVAAVHERGGLAIAAHIDRESFSLIGQLGFVPDDLQLDALEISCRITPEEAVRRYAPGLPLIQSSDAHRPEEIGRACTTFLIERASTPEIRKALQGCDGRRIER
jgi:hypothetical protein